MNDTNVDHVEVYPDDDDEFRWRAIAGNGEIVASGEAHPRADDAARAARGVFGDGVELHLLDLEGPEPTEGPVEE